LLRRPAAPQVPRYPQPDGLYSRLKLKGFEMRHMAGISGLLR